MDRRDTVGGSWPLSVLCSREALSSELDCVPKAHMVGLESERMEVKVADICTVLESRNSVLNQGCVTTRRDFRTLVLTAPW